MAKMDCFFKVFSILKLLEDNIYGITAEDISKYFTERGYDYTLRSAQNDMALLELVADDYDLDKFLIFEKKGRRKRIKLNKPPQLIESLVNQYKRAYISKLIEKCLGEDNIKREIEEIIREEENLSVFEILGFNIGRYKINQAIINHLASAIVTDSLISFEYDKIRTNEKKKYDKLLPLKILVSEDGWYLLVYDINDKEFKTFLADHINIKGTERIKNANLKKEKTDRLKEIEKSLKEAKSVWYVSKPQYAKEITAIISKNVGYKIIDMDKKGISYFSEQKILEVFEDGSIKISFKVADDGIFKVDFKKQVYPWIPDIKIIEPKEYVNFLMTDVERFLKT